jgi:hypothetical protein
VLTGNIADRHSGLHRLGDDGQLQFGRATPVITSTFENVSDIGACLGLSLGPPAIAGVRVKRVQFSEDLAVDQEGALIGDLAIEHSSMMGRSALSTVALLPIHALQNGEVSGRHRRHGRKPAALAAAADGKNETLADGRAHRRDRLAIDTGRADTGIEPPVIRRVSRQARSIAFYKVERHGHDDTHCRP